MQQCESSSASWQLQPDLHAQGTDTRVFKTTPDSFLRTDLAEHLARWGTQRLVVCGYATEFCIERPRNVTTRPSATAASRVG